MMRSVVLVSASMTLSTASIAHAAEDDFFAAVFRNVQNGTPCYGRTYDDAHLKTHPAQKVRRIEIDMDRMDSNERVNTPERFELGIAVMTTKSSEWYGNAAICKAGAKSAERFLDGDGGKFKLTASNDGAVRLETGDYGIGFEGEKDYIALSGTNGDDRVFLLKPGRAECDAASAYFDEAATSDVK